MRALIVAGVVGAVAVSLSCTSANAERIGKISQPLIGDPVSEKQQRRLGLVTVDGGCSGTMLNRYWVLTADHCITFDGNRGSISQKLEQLPVTASWTDRTAYPRRMIRYWSSTGLDVALLQIDDVFGRMDRKNIYHNPVDPEVTLTAFGQGLCALASEGPPPVPAEDDCGYRTAVFNPTRAHELGIYFEPNSRRQMTMGGDSGGPAFFTDSNGTLTAIAGVLATCTTSNLPGKEDEEGWDWVSEVHECGYSPLHKIRNDIDAATGEATPPPVADTRIPSGDVIASHDTERVASSPSSRAIGGIIVAGGGAPSAPPPPPPPPPAQQTARALNDVDIYDGPGGPDDDVVGMMEEGDRAAVIEKEGGWIKLRLGQVAGGAGWVAADHLSITP